MKEGRRKKKLTRKKNKIKLCHPILRFWSFFSSRSQFIIITMKTSIIHNVCQNKWMPDACAFYACDFVSFFSLYGITSSLYTQHLPYTYYFSFSIYMLNLYIVFLSVTLIDLLIDTVLISILFWFFLCLQLYNNREKCQIASVYNKWLVAAHFYAFYLFFVILSLKVFLIRMKYDMDFFFRRWLLIICWF